MAYITDSPNGSNDMRAEDDARTLTEAEAIKADKKRLKAALVVLKQHRQHKDNAIANAAPKAKAMPGDMGEGE